MQSQRELEGVGRGRRWPYALGLICLLIATAMFIYAPFGAVVYIALPGIAVAATFGIVDRSPARIALVLAAGAFATGLLIGIGGLALAGLGLLDDPPAMPLGLAIGAAALQLFPLAGLVIGLPALVMGLRRPGIRRVSADPDHLGLA